MRKYENGGYLIESEEELLGIEVPDDIALVFPDVETTSRHPNKKSTNPWFWCDVCSIAVCWTDTEGNNSPAYYIPVNHFRGRNIDRETVADWLDGVLIKSKKMVNHNIKYDLHVIRNYLGVVLADTKVCCTLTLAKLLDSDRLHYGLEYLCKDWLGQDIDSYKESLQPFLHKNSDYGNIPIMVLGPYACMDVLAVRWLYEYMQASLPEDCQHVAGVEEVVTEILFDIECTGLKVDPQGLKKLEYAITNKLVLIEGDLHETVGRPFRPYVGDDCYDVLCNQYGLPIMAYTKDDAGNETDNPSFDKHAMKKYIAHPKVATSEMLTGVCKGIQSFRKLNTLNNFFVKPYQELHVNNVMHPFYNQAVHTGRLACKEPNSMQLNLAAKRLVEVPEGYVLVSDDYSQVEFRLIVNYIKNKPALQAYRDNPFTDYHKWVADMAGIGRQPAKTLNFLMGYGGGKALAISKLQSEAEVIAMLNAQIDELIASGELRPTERISYFDSMSKYKALDMFNTYHATLPELKPTTKECENACKSRGYVTNLMGRRRRLPRRFAYKAFNNVCQSSAADIVKDRMVGIEMARRASIAAGKPHDWLLFMGQVHDDVMMLVREEYFTRQFVRDITYIMEDVRPKHSSLDVPIIVDSEWSTTTWGDAKGNASIVDRDLEPTGFMYEPTAGESSRFMAECREALEAKKVAEAAEAAEAAAA